MGWSLGWDSNWHRDIGYGVPATCDHPKCNEEIDRGLSFVCGGQPYGGEHGCGLYFCYSHLQYQAFGLNGEPITDDTLDGDDDPDYAQVCERCRSEERPFDPKPDVSEWLRWKLRDASWYQWRQENPKEVEKIREQLAAAGYQPRASE